MRFALVFILLLPTVAAADDKAPPPFRVRMPSSTAPVTDRQLERAVQKEQLEFFVRERVQRENSTFMQPYRQSLQNNSTMGNAITQAVDDYLIESQVNKALKDSRRR